MLCGHLFMHVLSHGDTYYTPPVGKSVRNPEHQVKSVETSENNNLNKGQQDGIKPKKIFTEIPSRMDGVPRWLLLDWTLLEIPSPPGAVLSSWAWSVSPPASLSSLAGYP